VKKGGGKRREMRGGVRLRGWVKFGGLAPPAGLGKGARKCKKRKSTETPWGTSKKIPASQHEENWKRRRREELGKRGRKANK